MVLPAGSSKIILSGLTIDGADTTAIFSDGASAEVDDCTFYGRETDALGAIYANDDSTLTLNNNVADGPVTGMTLCPGTAMTARGNSFTNVIEDAVVVQDSTAGINIDLGTSTSPGNNVFQATGTAGGTGYFGLSVGSDVPGVQAAGNTWEPNVQGADSNGHYASMLVVEQVTPTKGNYTTGSGSSVQF